MYKYTPFQVCCVIFLLFLIEIIIIKQFVFPYGISDSKKEYPELVEQLKREDSILIVRQKELKELRDKNKNIFTNQVARNEYIFFKNDSLISLMGSDSTIELLTINLSKKVRNEWRYSGSNNSTTSEASK